MKLYLRGDVWWVQLHNRRLSTKCTDERAAVIAAGRIELRLEVLRCIKRDPELADEVEAFLKRRAKKKGRVYVLRRGDAVKIGWTGNDPADRLAAAKTYTTEPIHLVTSFRGTRADERGLHERFASARIRGEWFRATDPEVAVWLIAVSPVGAAA